MLSITILIYSNAVAQNWPKVSTTLEVNQCAQEQLACYNHESLKDIYLYKQLCNSYKEESLKCYQYAKNIVKPVQWHQSKLSWLGLGIITGFLAFKVID